MKRLTPWLLAALVAAVGCRDDQQPLTAGNIADRLTVGLEVSARTAAPGDRVIIAVRADAVLDEPLQGVQATLRFDPSRLAYVGQSVGENLVLVNAARADQGELRLIAVDANGLAPRVASLVFTAKGGDLTSGLRLQFEGAASLHAELMRAGSRALAVAADLSAGQIARLSAEDWMSRLAPRGYKAWQDKLAMTPGQYATNLRYGDATLDGNINVLDVVYDANVSVGVTPLMDPSPTRDGVIAGNVRPVNGGTGGNPRPGVEPGGAAPDGQINVLDVVAIANNSVGVVVPVVGDLIPGREPLPLAGARVVINANISSNRLFKKDTVYQIGDATTANVYVTNGATLTIEPGTRIEGWYGTGVFGSGGVGQGQGTLIVQRDGWIVADGNALQPIVFTCALPPFAGPRGEPVNTRWPGCWGGLIIDGNATINADSPTSGPNPVNGTRSIAGCIQEQDESDALTLYGGCNDADSSGVLRYVRSEYGGARFTATKERNGLTFNGVGSHTLVDFVQVHASLDDGTEYFGGTVNVKHLLLTANEDDNVDWVLGWRGSGQFIIVQADSMDGDRCMEMDNNGIDAGNPDALPRSAPTIFNITCVGKAQPFRYTAVAGLPASCHTQLNSAGTPGPNCVNQAFIFRQNTAGIVRNAIAYRYASGLDFDQNTGNLTPSGLCAFVAAGLLRNAVISLGPTAPVPVGAAGGLSVAGDQDGTDPGVTGGVAGACGPYSPPTFTGSNLEALYIADPANSITTFGNDDVNGDYLVNPLEVLAPDFRPKAGSAPTTLAVAANPGTVNGFTFDNAPYLGAVAPVNGVNIPWYAGWTRGWTSSTTK
jgi:hypothetical protein